MSIDTYLRQIARGARGARDLDREGARDLFDQVLDRRASDLEIGAFCVAMRIKGESPAELAGFYDAVQARLPAIRTGRPVVLLPSYNGARKTPLMTPLLARMLADRGYGVLVHGLHEEARRTSAGDVFARMDWPVAIDADSAEAHLAREGFVYCPLEAISPDLAALLRVRKTIGLRNSGHVLAKLVNPVRTRALQIVNYTHPEYPEVLAGFFALHPANALYMRGHEGEPVPGPRRLPELAGCVDGKSVHTAMQIFDPLPDMAADISADATAAIYRQALSDAPATCPELVAMVNLIECLFPVNPAV